MKSFEKFCAAMDKVISVITVAIIAFITILVTVSVISLNLFNKPIGWQYEATLVCMSWIVFLGMSVTFRMDEHMRLTFISNALKPKTRAVWLAAMDTLVLAFLVVGGYLSLSVIKNAMPTMYQTIPISRGLFYLPFPIGCGASVCHIVNNNYKRLTGQLESVDVIMD